MEWKGLVRSTSDALSDVLPFFRTSDEVKKHFKCISVISVNCWEWKCAWEGFIDTSGFYLNLTSAIVCPWLDFGLPPQCSQVVWCHLGGIGPFSAALAQDRLAECDQPGKNPLKYSATAGNWTGDTGRTDSELCHWAIMTRPTGRTDSEIQ